MISTAEDGKSLFLTYVVLNRSHSALLFPVCTVLRLFGSVNIETHAAHVIGNISYYYVL